MSQIELQQIISDMKKSLGELQRLHELKRLRKYLKLVLIGFLIYRDLETRISEAKARIDSIVRRITSCIGELSSCVNDFERRIKEFADIHTRLKSVEERVKDFGERLNQTQNSVLRLEESIPKYREVLRNCLKQVIRQRLSNLGKQVTSIENSGTYLIFTDKQKAIGAIKSFENDLDYCARTEVLDGEYVSTRKKELENYLHRVLNYNDEFVARHKKEYSYLWRVRSGLLSLDDEQQTAIVRDDKHNLVVAAAGSGKTEVLITRIAYLVQARSVRTERILAIAYQKKDVRQIKQCLQKYFGITGVTVSNFHQLGIEVLRRAGKFEGVGILDEDKQERTQLIKEIYENKLSTEPSFHEDFLRYVKHLHDTETEKTDIEEAYQLKRILPYRSIDNTLVRSLAEKEILDFFLTTKLNGNPIEVEYEPYVVGLAPKKPDFRLVEYDLFIEHWGLDKEGNVPEGFEWSSENYRKNMNEKKKWFAENNKLLVETYTYEYDEDHPDRFLQLLKNRVIEKVREKHEGDYSFTSMTHDEILNIAREPGKSRILTDQITEDIANFIKNAKTYDIPPEKIVQRLAAGKWSRKQHAFGTLAAKVYKDYTDSLAKLNKIDFEDMINGAVKELNSAKHLFFNAFDHILVDEYQDISRQRYRLIQQLLDHNLSCRLFCVGDDWQSIMGFAGSNLEFFVNFEKYFSNPAVSIISTNYRSAKSIVDAGADLIKNNGSCQRAKPTLSHNSKVTPIKVLTLVHEREFEKNYYKQMVDDCLNQIQKHLDAGYRHKEILVLSRFLRGFPRIGIIFEERAKEKGIRVAVDQPRAKGRVRFLTIHKCKGLEAKVVFVLNVIKDVHGIPCEIEDPAIYAAARDSSYPSQNHVKEERRVFYVAMTRAMEDLYIYTWKPARSEFLDEIDEHIDEIELPY